MWIKHLANGTKIVETDKNTWLTTDLNSIVRVDMVLPQHIFKNNRFSLAGSGPYHQAIKARSVIGGKPVKICEYIQRFNGNGWVTIEADYIKRTVKQYILAKRLGV